MPVTPLVATRRVARRRMTGREAAAGGADELAVAVLGGELGGRAEAGEDGFDGRAGFDGVADVRGDFAEDVFAVGEGDGGELGAEVGEVGFGGGEVVVGWVGVIGLSPAGG